MNKKKFAVWLLFLIPAAGGWFFFPVKPDLYRNAYFSSVVYDRNGVLLSMATAKDEIYRVYTPLSDISQDLIKAVLLYEDRYYYYHFGFNPFSVLRSAWTMAFGGRKMGASTITMQLARAVYGLNTSNICGKIKQIVYAVVIEAYYSKKEILEAYLNVAPYGHNIEGVGAASLIYFHTEAKKLSVQQAMVLAVIPQNPVLRAPDTARGIERVLEAENYLAEKWKRNGNKDTKSVFLPLKVYKMSEIPFKAPHWSRRMMKDNSGNIRTSLDYGLQKELEKIFYEYIKSKRIKGVKNGAVLLKNFRTGETLAYIGSISFFDDAVQGQVDGVDSLRSPGSVLKPFIYALAMDYGIIHPMSLLKDIPRNYGVYSPENFDRHYKGAVSATDALNSSRNVPAVELLLALPDNAFYRMLQKAGIRRLKSADFYGLALALGGAEITLENAVDLYAMLGNLGVYRDNQRMLSPESAFLTVDMLSKNPFEQKLSRYIKKDEKDIPVAWKTGTSYSYKDAWTAGLFGDFALGVWIGNFDGEPNHSFVGRTMAAPLFFKIVDYMKRRYPMESRDIALPYGLNLQQVDICDGTFDIAGKYCPYSFKSWIIPLKSPIKVSDIHRLLPVMIDSGKRACRYEKGKTILKVFEVWPSDLAAVFKRLGIHKNSPPPFAKDCLDEEIVYYGKKPEIIYPVAGLEYMIDVDAGSVNIPFKATIDNDASTVFWFVDDAYVGKSLKNEMFSWSAKPGDFVLTAVDDLGRNSTAKIVVRSAK